MTAGPQPQLPIPEPRTGIRIRTPRQGAPDPIVYVDSCAGSVVLDITDHNGNRAHLLISDTEARDLAAVIAKHVQFGRY